MGSDEEIGGGPTGTAIGQRLGVGTSTAAPMRPAFSGASKRAVRTRTARGVDEQSALLHEGKLCCADHAGGVGVVKGR